MKLAQRKRVKPLLMAVAAFSVLVGGLVAQPVGATPKKFDIQYASTAEATVQNIDVTAEGNTVRAQFDYDLRGTATSATVDIALNDQLSVGQVEVTGPGHYDQTLTDLPDGSYSVYVIISGDPDYLLHECGQANQPMILTLPSTAAPASHSSDFVKSTRHSYHWQHRYF